MARSFTTEVSAAGLGEKSALRGLQAWQYLIARARNGELVRYDELRELMEYPTCNPVIHALNCIGSYCLQNDLPPLVAIVVNQSGVPGDGFPADLRADLPVHWRRVFDYPWFRVVPPTVEELRMACANDRRGAPEGGPACRRHPLARGTVGRNRGRR